MTTNRFLARMSIETTGAALSETRIRLLEEIGQKGSINQAAKAVPLSYKAAWDAIDTMNNLAPEPLVERVIGGRQGGGTRLTEYGHRIVAMYRALEQENQHTLDRLAEKLNDMNGADILDFQRQIRRMNLNTSARNVFYGTVSAMRDGAVDFEVSLRIDPQIEIVAIITKASAENLALQMGKEVCALVKASSVLITTERDCKLSARNQLWGRVTEVHEGGVNDEVTLVLPSGRTVTAVITRESAVSLGIGIGVEACAFFKSASVILAAFD